MTGRGLFSEADVRRAIKAARSAGLQVGEIKIEPDGSIRVLIRDESGKDGLDRERPWSF